MSIIVGMTFALFSDSRTIRNHLQAGNLDISLKRTHLEYAILGDDGTLDVITVADPHDFTDSTSENVFGLDDETVRIVPGSYFKAEMTIQNRGNVAFEYFIGLQLIGESNALTDQLEVVLKPANGAEPITKKLSELAIGLKVKAGEMLNSDPAQTFVVEVRFIDDNQVNNDAKDKLAIFDLVVSAVQLT